MRDPGCVSTFNRIAEVYDRRYGRACAVAHRHALNHVRALNLTPRVVLDIGCGTGQLLAEAVRIWPDAELIGVDPAEHMIEVARRRLPHARLLVGHAERLSVQSATVDLVLSTTSFGHWADQCAGLREVARVLCPGGRCVIVEHAPPGVLVALAYRLVNRLPQLRDAVGMAALATDAGLPPPTVVDVDDFLVTVLVAPRPTPGTRLPPDPFVVPSRRDTSHPEE